MYDNDDRVRFVRMRQITFPENEFLFFRETKVKLEAKYKMEPRFLPGTANRIIRSGARNFPLNEKMREIRNVID